MKYLRLKRYDLHCHSCVSACSVQSPREIVKTALSIGLYGLAVTDHNEIAGALKAREIINSEFRKEVKKRDFELIIGEEIMTDRCEVLAYYLNERIRPGPLFEVLDKIKEQGAISSIAHPYTVFRKGFKGDISEIKRKVDALECFNARNIVPGRNAFAESQAKKYKFAMTGGSDAHSTPEIGRGVTLFDATLSLSEAIKQRKTSFSGSCWYAPYGAVLSAFSKIRRGLL